MPRNLRTHFAIDGLAANRVVSAREHHELGRPPVLDVEVRYDSYLPLDDILGRPAWFEMRFEDEEPHQFAGIVEEVSVGGTSMTERSAHQYRLRVVPKIAVLARSVDAVIYQEKDVQEIVSDVLERHQITAYEWRLTAPHHERTYCVQYQESGLDFIHRLLEEEGIYYFVEVGDDGDTIVLSDDSTAADAISGESELEVRGRHQMGIDRDYALLPSDRERLCSGKLTLRDYDFEKPALDLTVEATADADADLEVYDYPGLYSEPSVGRRLARVRLEAEQVWRRSLAFDAVCPRIAAGRSLTLTDAADLDGEYCVVAVVHDLADEGREDEDRAPELTSRATVVPKDTPFRLAQRTPRPVIHGPQTAQVAAPVGSEMEAVHTDEHGRCKVRFPWDRSGITDDRASCWLRVAQLQTSGSLIVPRIHWEVIVEYLEGNPDRPVVTGKLYNGLFMPPYQLPEGKTRTSLQTRTTPGGGGSNEIRFEDQAGAEEIMVRAQRDMKLATANDKSKSVGNNETLVIGASSSLSVGADQTIRVTKGTQHTVGGDQSVSVDGNRNLVVNAVTGLMVHGAASTSVGGSQMEMVGNALEGLLAVAAERTEEFLEAKADQAVQAVQGHVQGAVDQALGPVNELTSQAESLGNEMQRIADGDLSSVGGLVGDASGMPGAGDFARSLGGEAPTGGGSLSDVVEGGNLIQAAASGAVEGGASMASRAAQAAVGAGVGAGHEALADALGVRATGGGGESMENVAGPEGDVGGQEELDREKGPGHSIGKIAGSYDETVGGMKVQGVLDGMDTNVGGSMTQNAGAAHVEVMAGDRAESGDGSKTESALGLVVLSKDGESETAAGARTTMVGGAVIDKLSGSHAIEAGAPATLIGAFHKLEASGSITLTCGASELVIDGSGISISAPMVTMMGSKVHLPKNVSEN